MNTEMLNGNRWFPSLNGSEAFDIVGDVHGFKNELIRLLKKLDYHVDEQGVWGHSSRIAVFVGDFIDRGPNSMGVIDLVRKMINAGKAIAVLGNHEINAILYFTRGADGKRLKVPSAAAQKMLEEVESQYPSTEKLLEDIKWLRTLPVCLDMGKFRVVHAYWNNAHVQELPSMYKNGKLRKRFLKESTKKASPLYKPFNETLKGVEIAIPDNMVLRDEQKVSRSSFRVKWWIEPYGETFYSLSYGNKFVLPNYTIPKEIIHNYSVYPKTEPIVFMGHYCMGNGPLIVSNNVCCVDSCIAGEGRLAAYRYNGESELSENNFVFVKKEKVLADL